MISDPERYNKKCSSQGHRIFDFRGENATEYQCKEECMKNDECIAFSALWNKWCIGCRVELEEQVQPNDDGAIAFKKKGISASYKRLLKSSN